MKGYVLGLLMSILTFTAFGSEEKIYISSCTGHRLSFLIVYDDGSAGIEDYHSQAKASIYQFSAKTIKPGDLIVDNEEKLHYKEQVYTLASVQQTYGDFERFYPGFEKMGNAEKLNICRNIYACKRRKASKMNFEQSLQINNSILHLPCAKFKEKMK